MTSDRAVAGRVWIVVVLLGCLSLGTARAENEGRGVFALEDKYALGGSCAGLAPADFDLDGDVDVAAAVSDAIQFHRNDGSGRLELGAGLPLTVLGIQAVDFDRDGRIDLLGRVKDTVAVIRNWGAFAFERVPLDLPRISVAALDVADLDADGWPDLAIANGIDSSLTVLWGDPDGRFQAHVRVLLTGPPIAIACGDLDGDGVADVAVSQRGDFLDRFSKIWLHSFGPSRTARELGVIDPPFGFSSLHLLDLEQDGRCEILGGYEYEVMGYVGDPLGGYVSFTFPGHFIREPAWATGDVDRDGRPDLVLSDGYGGMSGLSILFDPLGAHRDSLRLSVGARTLPSNSYQVRDIHLRDMDSDGRLDLVMTINSLYGGGQALCVVRNLGVRRFAAASLFPLGSTPLGLSSADLDGNGRHELILLTADAVARIDASADGTLRSPSVIHPPVRASNQPYWLKLPALSVGDLNRDGADDLVLADGDSVRVSLSSGEGRLGPDQICGPAWIGGTGDFDGDGWFDLLAVTPNLQLELWRNDGSGRLLAPVPAGDLPAMCLEAPWVLTGADLDEDGRAEIVIVSGMMVRIPVDSLFVGHVFESRYTSYPVPFELCPSYYGGTRVVEVDAADLDRGGGLDVLVHRGNIDGGTILTLVAEGATGYAPRGCGSVPSEKPPFIAVADFDGDGISDYAGVGAQEGNEARVHVEFGDGTGAFDAQRVISSVYLTMSGSCAITAVDLERDGRPEIAVALTGSSYYGNRSEIAILHNPRNTPLVTTHATCTADPDAIRLRWTFPAAPAGTLERRASPDTLWRTLGWPDRDGEHDLVYHDRDVEPGQTIAYRLRAPNGTVVAGSEVTIVVPQPALRIVSLGPNPARGDLTLRFRLGAIGPARADVFDLLGRRAHTHHLEAPTLGEQSAPLPLAPLAPGVYFLRLEQGRSRATARFAIVR